MPYQPPMDGRGSTGNTSPEKHNERRREKKKLQNMRARAAAKKRSMAHKEPFRKQTQAERMGILLASSKINFKTGSDELKITKKILEEIPHAITFRRANESVFSQAKKETQAYFGLSNRAPNDVEVFESAQKEAFRIYDEARNALRKSGNVVAYSAS